MKKAVLFSLVLCIVLICAFSVTAFAQTDSDNYKSSQAYTLVKEICESLPSRQAGESLTSRKSR